MVGWSGRRRWRCLNVLHFGCKTHKVLPRSVIQSAGDVSTRNLRVLFPPLSQDGDKDASTVSFADVTEPKVDPTTIQIPRFSPDELIGLSFL